MRALALLLGLALAGCNQIRLGVDLGAPDATAPAPPLAEGWERDADGAFGPAPALVTSRYVVVGTRQGDVVVLDRETGQIKGRGGFGDSIEGQMAVSDDRGALYVPTADADGGVESFDVRGGQRLWRWRGGAIQGGVALVEGALVAVALDGRVAGLDPATGTLRWERPSAPGAQFHAAPLALGADVVVADDRGRVARLDAATGDEVWAADVGAPVYAVPAAADGAVFVTTTRGHVLCLDAATGAVGWTVTLDDAPRASPPVPGPAGVAVGFSDGTVRLLDAATGAERWRFETDGNVTAAPAWVGDHLAVGTLDRRLVLLDGTDGAVVWATTLRGRVKSAVAVGGGMVVVLAEPRHVVAFVGTP